MVAIAAATASCARSLALPAVRAEVAEQYAARQRSDGVWVQAAAWLATARGC